MNIGELRRLLNRVPLGVDRDPVMFQDTTTGTLFTVKAVEYEPPSYDGDGNVTSTGGTLWLRGEEY